MINHNYQKLQPSYLFTAIRQRTEAYSKENPGKTLVRLGASDVTRPLVPAVIDAMHKAVAEMGDPATFQGYDDGGTGYEFLRNAIADYYQLRGIIVSPEDIVVNDGAKSDCGNLPTIFASGATVVLPDVGYPVYADSNIMAGNYITWVEARRENDFMPLPPKKPAHLVYLCSPNNPSGAVYTREGLQAWVDYANACGAVIIYDAGHESYIRDPALPTSIYQIPGAETCAIEVCTFSKLAGFTGVRCGYTIVPSSLMRDGKSLHALWLRRQNTLFNGVGYVVQRAAEAVLSSEGLAQCRQNIEYYMENAKLIRQTLEDAGLWVCGGDNAPYIWTACPKGFSSWEFFEHLLNEAGIVGTPGVGFGAGGEGYMRFTAFRSRKNVELAMARLRELL